ncbi:hypothetical protein E2C01_037505 [Portunus trituberculatus]|uniref:Uncharacterized protein n=1 Tax=Portunus trituberculatus TaxID=210409 RepID=A0A5B7F9I8_PORTR|nr:hypothetical protein [Portunus trituberculatus]
MTHGQAPTRQPGKPSTDQTSNTLGSNKRKSLPGASEPRESNLATRNPSDKIETQDLGSGKDRSSGQYLEKKINEVTEGNMTYCSRRLYNISLVVCLPLALLNPL